MKLVIGGYGQGKLTYVLAHMGKENSLVADGIPEEIAPKENAPKQEMVINHFHVWVKKQLAAGQEIEPKLWDFLKEHPDCVIICDEIGNGIVPVDAFERNYREQCGRLLVKLAGQADEVVRVICGIGQKIK